MSFLVGCKISLHSKHLSFLCQLFSKNSSNNTVRLKILRWLLAACSDGLAVEVHWSVAPTQLFLSPALPLLPPSQTRAPEQAMTSHTSGPLSMLYSLSEMSSLFSGEPIFFLWDPAPMPSPLCPPQLPQAESTIPKAYSTYPL